MDVRVELPAEVVEALGPKPEREVLEGVLLLLVSEGKMSVARAGELLGLEGRISAIRWYTGHGLPYPDLSEEDLSDDLKYSSSSVPASGKEPAVFDASPLIFLNVLGYAGLLPELHRFLVPPAVVYRRRNGSNSRRLGPKACEGSRVR